MVARRPKRFSLPSWLKRSVVSALTSIPDVPSLVREIAGPRVTGSWWSHPRGKAIYAAYRRACEHPDVLALKLIEGKITFVHRRIWPALLCCALDPERVKRSLRAAPRR